MENSKTIIYEYEKYVTTPEQLKETLETLGVAIIPNVLTQEECGSMKTGMWEYLEHITQKFKVPLKRDNPKTWRSFSELFALHSMLIQHHGIGHAQYIWDLRTNPKIYNIFSKLWDVEPEELLVSFDGASCHLPSEETGVGWYQNKDWFHTDQSYMRNDMECIQSWVTGCDVHENDGTLAILEGSHKYHKRFAKHFKIEDTSDSRSDWYKLNCEEQKYYESKGCQRRSIKCPAGSIVFWDSRTIHCGQQPVKGREMPNMRCVVYLCYTPRDCATQTHLKKKIKAYEELRTTSHWPHKPKLFAKNPRTYGKQLQPITAINKPVIPDIGRKFIGY